MSARYCATCPACAARKVLDQARRRRHYQRDPAGNAARTRRWEKANPEKVKAMDEAKKARRRQRLADSYVRKLLSSNTQVPLSAWPDDIVALKRASVKLKRAMKAKTNANS